MGVAVFGVPVMMILSALTVTNEYRSGMIRTTFMAVPNRTLVLVAKAVVAAVFSGFYAAVMVMASIVVAHSDPAATGGLVGAHRAVRDAGRGAGRRASARCSRASAGAVALLLLWPLVAEPLLGNMPNISPQVGPYLPFANAFTLHRRAVAVPVLRHAVGTSRVDRVLRRRGGRGVRRRAGHGQPARRMSARTANVGAMVRKSRAVSALCSRRSASSWRVRRLWRQDPRRKPPTRPRRLRRPVRQPNSRATLREPGHGRRDDGAPDRNCRRSPTPTTATARSAPRATTPASTTSRRRCVTRVSTCRRPSSRCGCRSPRSPQLTVGGATIEAKPLEFTIGTPDGGVSGPLVVARVDDSPGCTASDYDGLPVEGAVVLVDRGACPFAQKQAVAAERGAVGADRRQQRGRRRDGRHARRGRNAKIPVVSITKDSGERLRGAPGDDHPQAQGRGRRQEDPQRHRADEDRLGRRRGDGRRAPGQRAGGAGDQRQRLRCRRGAGDRAAAGPVTRGAQRGAVRLLGRRGARAAGLGQLRRVTGCRRSSRTSRCI